MTQDELIIRKVTAIRQSQKMSQAELARRSGVHQPQISRLECMTHSPSLWTILRILEPLGYTLDIVPKE